ncbi:hypothetical protein BDN71DRAFT_1513237 [Pleurotus eryngii]|uniref:Uncharacterized protein n=1 Tax=Pleurotus eryngii TaxID=5323 RepID=A0A9P5ZKD3_PLEER|nr:hypothetical protein BDN71DRAFT_1513237 [Pleurotus eryngii]
MKGVDAVNVLSWPVLAPVPVSVPPSPQYPRTPQELRNFGSLNTPTLPQITPGTSVHSTPPHPFPNSHRSPDLTLRICLCLPFSPLRPTATPPLFPSLVENPPPPALIVWRDPSSCSPSPSSPAPSTRLPRRLHHPPPARPQGKPLRRIRPLLGPRPAPPRLRSPLPLPRAHLPPPRPVYNACLAAAVQ